MAKEQSTKPQKKVTVQAAQKAKEGEQYENSPYPVKVDRAGNRKFIPTEMVKFRFNSNNKHVAEGTEENLHTFHAEDLSARGKGEILGKAEMPEVPKKYKGSTDATK